MLKSRRTGPRLGRISRTLKPSHLLVALELGQEREVVSDGPRVKKLATFSVRTAPLEEVLTDEFRTLTGAWGPADRSTPPSCPRRRSPSPPPLRWPSSGIRVSPHQTAAATGIPLHPLRRAIFVLVRLLRLPMGGGIAMEVGARVPIAPPL